MADVVLAVGQEAHGLEQQLGGLAGGVELQARDHVRRVDVLGSQPLGVGFQGALVTVFLAEDRGCGQGQLQHVAFHIVGQHHSKTLLVAAGAGVSVARPGDVLRALVALGRLLLLAVRARGHAVGGPAVGRTHITCVELLGVEHAVHGGRGVDHNHVQMAVLDAGNLLAAGQQTEHAALDRDALAAAATATCEGLGYIGQAAPTLDEIRHLARVEQGHIAHVCFSLLGWFANRNLILRHGVQPSGHDAGVFF